MRRVSSSLIVYSSSILSILLGLVVLIGWHFEISRMIQIQPMRAPMQYNTALGFIFGGLFLGFNQKNKTSLASICGTIVFLLGLLTIIEYVFHIICILCGVIYFES